MKELSIEEKAKLYDEAKINGSRLWECGEITRTNYEFIFPDLKESEDERIMKEIAQFIRMEVEDEKVGNKWIAWLKKQGEHANFRNKIQIGDKVTRNDNGELVNLSQLQRVAKPSIPEIVDEHFYEMLDDKTEPKFREGDWVIDKQGIVHQIANVVENVTYHTYGYDIVGGGYFNENTEGIRLWTIEDAKDGDVLADNYGIYIFDRFDEYDEKCYICMGAYQYSQKVYENEHMLCSVEVHPATKEQRDLLFQKMHEAGYEWNVEKKELTKIEQNPAWSEEDEKEYRRVEYAIMIVFGGDAYLIGWIRKFKNKLLHQTAWKPNEVQIEALQESIGIVGELTPRGELLKELAEQLKKL